MDFKEKFTGSKRLSNSPWKRIITRFIIMDAELIRRILGGAALVFGRATKSARLAEQ